MTKVGENFIENLDLIMSKLREIETILTNIIKLASNPALPLDFLKGLHNVKVYFFPSVCHSNVFDHTFSNFFLPHFTKHSQFLFH